MFHLFFLICITLETDLMSEIEKLSQEKHLQSKNISQLEQNIQKLSNHFNLSKYTSDIFEYSEISIF